MPRFNGHNRFNRNKSSSNRGGFFRGRSSRGRSSGRSFGRGGRKMLGEHIDISKFVKKSLVCAVVEPVVIENKFSDFGLCPQLEKNLEARKYLVPTPIQDKSILHTMSGRDLIGLANTGTGKTAAFLLPMITKVFKDKNQKVLIVAPTRELAIQIDEEFKKFVPSLGLRSVVCVGGAPIYRQLTTLRRDKPNFVIGTPGRLKDLRERNALHFSVFQNVVLDEIDRMLDMGFIDEVKRMLAEMPKQKQSLFFSATMPPKIKELTKQFLIDPVTVKVSKEGASENVDQDIVRCNRFAKFDKLKDLLINADLKKVLIFSETKRDVERLVDGLIRDGFKADSIHGDRKHNQRQKALLRFKESHIQILVATDVAARGLDIKNITHVINYTIPQTYDDYIHRIGRTGRGNEKGFALTFVEIN